MKKIFVIFRWTAVIVLLITLVIFTNDRQDMQRISLNDIKIVESDNNFVTPEIVLDYLKIKSVDFDNILIKDFSKALLENLLKHHPLIKAAEVFVDQKGKVNILIEQKKAIVRVKTDIYDYYLDEFGHKMELSNNFTARVVVATGDVIAKNHSEIYSFVNEINKSDFWNSQITQIHFENNDVVLIPRVGGQKINIGSFKNIEEKLNNLYHFYKVGMPLKGWQTYSIINLKFKDQVICIKK